MWELKHSKTHLVLGQRRMGSKIRPEWEVSSILPQAHHDRDRGSGDGATSSPIIHQKNVSVGPKVLGSRDEHLGCPKTQSARPK